MKKIILAFLMTSIFVFAESSSLYQKEEVQSLKRCGYCGASGLKSGFVGVAKMAKPAVVFLRVKGQAVDPYQGQNPYDFFQDDFFNRFFGIPPGGQQRPKPQPQMSQGSGFFVSADGYIMTNAHVVHDAVEITAVLNNGTELPAKLVGTDPHTDLAVVKVEGSNFTFLKLTDSESIEVGEWAIAIGSPFQLEATVTVGVVSAKGRNNLRINDLEDFIQTDAAINPGNSGGPLLNINGEVMGVNAAIVSKSGGYMGIGFAIPSNMARHVMQQIIDNGVVDRGFLGVSLQPLDKELAEAFGLDQTHGAVVAQVVPDSPAAKAGLQAGDIITAYNDKQVRSASSIRNEISMMTPGTVIDLTVNRNGRIMHIPVTLGSRTEVSAESSQTAQKLGIDVENLTPEMRRKLSLSPDDEGVVITRVKPGSIASQAGIRPGFVIIAINHKKSQQYQRLQSCSERYAKQITRSHLNPSRSDDAILFA